MEFFRSTWGLGVLSEIFSGIFLFFGNFCNFLLKLLDHYHITAFRNLFQFFAFYSGHFDISSFKATFES